MWPVNTLPTLLEELNCACMPRFRPVAPFFSLAKVPFFGLFFFGMQKGMWPYRHAYDIPLVTPILNIYGFVGPTSTIQA